VGKSSLINMLVGQNSLAKVSVRPGKTQLINHFIIDESWYLVDLPGYGYAKIAISVKEKFQKLISRYILDRENLYCLFVLIDIRHSPQQIDVEFITWLGENEIPFAIIFTKADKLGKVTAAKNVAAYTQELKKIWEELPPVFVSSSLDGTGKDEIISYIESINKS
jgi:GTP-binding protein